MWAEGDAYGEVAPACWRDHLNYAQSIVFKYHKLMREHPTPPPTWAEIIIYVAAELQRHN